MKTLFTMICLIGAAALGQTLPVVDESPADSPLHFSGDVIYNGNNTECAVTGRNDGSSRIVAWVAELHGVKALFVQDLFFYDERVGHILMLGDLGLEDATYDREPDYHVHTGMLCFAFNYHRLTAESSMRVKVRLVQFEDDSVWGDRAAINELASQRRDTISFLRSLQSAPNLNKALAESNYGSEDVNADRVTWDRRMVEAPLHYTSKTRDEIVAEIENRLAIAETHKAWLDALE